MGEEEWVWGGDEVAIKVEWTLGKCGCSSWEWRQS